MSSHQRLELMASLKIERKPQANFWSIISRFPPPHIFVSEGENTNYAEAFFIPRIFLEFASRLSTDSVHWLFCAVCKINFAGIILLCKQYAASPISMRTLDHFSCNGLPVQWLGPTIQFKISKISDWKKNFSNNL